LVPSRHLGNVIQPGSAFSTADELASVYPTNTLDPGFPRLRLGEWSAVSREGWIFPTQLQRGSEYVQLQLGRDAFIEWFGKCGLKATPSDAGRVAEQIIGTAGGLHSCAIFADEAVVKLLDDMAATRVLRDRGARGVEESNYPDRAAPLKRWEELGERPVACPGLRSIGLPKGAFYERGSKSGAHTVRSEIGST
jgi:hypothetical protein